MLIATKRYLEKLKTPVLSGNKVISVGTETIVTIPCYNEPDIHKTIQSLINCEKPDCPVEILVLVNAYMHSPQQVLEVNRQTYSELQSLAEKYYSDSFKIIPLYTEQLEARCTGAGIPRKMLMDEALRRFASIDKDNGIIVSLDADCTVDKNYLREIEMTFRDEEICVATIEFHHPVEHLATNDPLRQSMELYELYLHYFHKALKYVGYPYPYYTIGSAMAFRASVYSRAGGMGKQAAGEDFYFLQKVFPLGKTKHIDTTKVYPAARFSDRVPFGTGPALQKMVSENKIEKMTYSFESFQALKSLFDKIDTLYSCGESDVNNLLVSFPDFLQEFLQLDHFMEHWSEIKSNVSNVHFFRKRFFHFFNAFKIVKYLNFVHQEKLSLKDVRTEYEKVLKIENK